MAAPGSYTPLEFCEILHAYWNGRSSSRTPIAESTITIANRKRCKGKGKAREDNDENENLPLHMNKNTRIIRQGKTFYSRVDLSASTSCTRHVNALQMDVKTRQEADRLLCMAQNASSQSAACRESNGYLPRGGEGGGAHVYKHSSGHSSGETTSSGIYNPAAASPSKRRFRNAQQLIQAEKRAETLERRIYLRLLISRTILRYIEKNTGCKYIFRGDKVDHYPEEEDEEEEEGTSTKMPITNKPRCNFFYDCGSADYEEPCCAGTLRIIVDLNVGTYLVDDSLVPLKSSNGEEGTRIDTNTDTRYASRTSSPPLNDTLPPSFYTTSRTPTTRTYGSKRRATSANGHARASASASASVSREALASLTSSVSRTVNSRLSFGHPRGRSSTTPSASAAADGSVTVPTISHPPLIFSIRMTHLTHHQQPYKLLRKQYKLEKEERDAKLAIVQRKMDKLKEEMMNLQSFGEGSAAYEMKLDRLLEKVRRAHTPRSSDDDDDDSEEDESGSDRQAATEAEAESDDADEHPVSGEDINSHEGNLQHISDIVVDEQMSRNPTGQRRKSRAQVFVEISPSLVNTTSKKKVTNGFYSKERVLRLCEENLGQHEEVDNDEAVKQDNVATSGVHGVSVTDNGADTVDGNDELDHNYNQGNESEVDGVQQVSDSESSSQDEVPIEDPTSQDNHPPLSDEDENEDEDEEKTAFTPSVQGDMTDYSEPEDVALLKRKRGRSTVFLNSSAQTKVSDDGNNGRGGKVGKGRNNAPAHARGRGRGRKKQSD